MVSVSPRGGAAAAGAGLEGGLTLVLGWSCSETRFLPSNCEPGTAMSAAVPGSRRKLGALCRRGLSRAEGCLWARLLGVLGSVALLGTGRPLARGWEAASRGTEAVKDWANVAGVLMWESRCSGVWVRGDTLLVSEPTKPLSVSGDAIQDSSRWGPPAWRRDLCGSRSETPLPSRLVRLLWWDAEGLVPCEWGGLPGPGGAASALPRPSRDPSLATGAWKPPGFLDTMCPTVSSRGVL